MSNQEMSVIDTQTNLSVNLTDRALSALGEQRSQLKKFISSQLEKDVDFGIIPGTKKPSLYKPGAEKVANIFQLGSRIVKSERTIDVKENFAMFATTVEIFHLPTGKAIAQCEGIANSQEKKYATRMNYQAKKQEDTPIGDVLNTLSKMAQKRAYVGAVLIACGASDFFTQDMEDVPREYINQEQPKTVSSVKFTQQKPQPAPAKEQAPAQDWEEPAAEIHDAKEPVGYIVSFGKFKGRTLSEMEPNEIESYCSYIKNKAQKEGKEITGQVLEFINEATAYLESYNAQ